MPGMNDGEQDNANKSDEEIRDAMLILLSSGALTENGLEAVTRFKRNESDVNFMDMHMPRCSPIKGVWQGLQPFAILPN